MFRAQRTIVRLAICLGAVICVLAPAGVQAQMMKKLNLDQLVEKSDNIFTATCTEKEVVWQNGAVVTKYKLKVNENWKGTASASKNGEIEMEEVGGVLPGSGGMTQFLPGMANMSKQEEVLLFTAKPTYNPQVSAVNKSPQKISAKSLRIVGASQGRFTIVRHPETGKRLVSRVGVEPYPGSIKTPLLNRISKLEQAESSAAAKAALGGSQTDMGQVAERKKLSAKVDQLAKASKTNAVSGEALDPSNEVIPFEALDGLKARVAEKMEKQGVKN
ncbi:MAG: hypothetical protein ABFD69_11245 [Candidatus Sumerlaeia bacterium]